MVSKRGRDVRFAAGAFVPSERELGHLEPLDSCQMRMPEALSPLREPRFRLLYLAQTASVVGDSVSPIAIAFAVLGLTGSATDLGIVLAARSIPMVLLVVPAGVIADRFGRGRVVIASDLVSLASQGGLAALLIAGQAHLWQLILLQTVYGAAAALFLPASSGLVPETVSAERLQRANALRFQSIGAAGVVGPALGGVLVATVGSGSALAIDAATFAVSASLLSRLGSLGTAPGEQRPSLVSELALGWREVRARAWVWVSILDFGFFQFFVLGSLYVLGPLVASRSLGGASAWGLVLAAYGLGAVVGSTLALRVTPRRPLVTAFLGSLAFPPALVLLGFPAPLLVLAAGWTVAGVALGLGNVLWETTLQEGIPAKFRSRVSAYDWLGSIAMRPLGLAAAGPLAGLLGVDLVLWLAAAALAATTALTLTVPSIRRLERGGATGEPEQVDARLLAETDYRPPWKPDLTD